MRGVSRSLSPSVYHDDRTYGAVSIVFEFIVTLFKKAGSSSSDIVANCKYLASIGGTVAGAIFPAVMTSSLVPRPQGAHDIT